MPGRDQQTAGNGSQGSSFTCCGKPCRGKPRIEPAAGSVNKAQRLTQESNIRWRTTVEPDSGADVSVVLPATTDCSADGAICTADGRVMSTGLS